MILPLSRGISANWLLGPVDRDPATPSALGGHCAERSPRRRKGSCAIEPASCPKPKHRCEEEKQ